MSNYTKEQIIKRINADWYDLAMKKLEVCESIQRPFHYWLYRLGKFLHIIKVDFVEYVLEGVKK